MTPIDSIAVFDLEKPNVANYGDKSLIKRDKKKLKNRINTIVFDGLSIHFFKNGCYLKQRLAKNKGEIVLDSWLMAGLIDIFNRHERDKATLNNLEK